MTQDMDSNVDSDVTVRIPENARPTLAVPAADPGSADHGESRKKGDSTAVHSVVDRIFTREERLSNEPFSLQADTSLDFRSGLERIGKKYKIEKVVATGGFGRIFQAEDKVLGRKAIVKTLKEEFLQDEKAIEHFITEAKLSSQLDHPGVVPLFSLDTDANKGLHLAMQRITGITLKAFLKRCRELQLQKHFSQKIYNKMLRERLELFLRVCDTIAYCHDRKVLHNDLKSDNVMIGRHGQVYVMDWGLACVENGEKPDHSTGSPAYMAPERICSRILSKRTDIFSLGMILNELVTLRPPIEEDSVSKVAERICTGRFEPSTCMDPRLTVPVELRAIIEKGRNPDPQKRYPSVLALANDVRHFLFHEETAAYPDSFPQKVFRFLFHHRGIAAFLVGMLVLLFLAALGYNFYNAGVITRKAARDTVWKLNLAKSAGNKSAAIGKTLLLFQEQTANMGSALAIEIGKKQYDSEAPFYWNGDFAAGSGRRPPGLIHTAAYKNKAITLSAGTFYRFQKQISRQEIQDWANNFRAQQSQHLANVLAHVRKEEIAYKSDKLKLFYEYGSTVQRIVCVLDNGLVYCYPGKYEPAASKDSFVPEFVRRELRSGKDFAWSSPYSDPVSGYTVVSCWHTIRTLRGNKIGVIGMVIVYKDLLKEFLCELQKDQEPAVSMLVDSEARTVYSSGSDAVLALSGTESASEEMTGHHPYKWYSEVIRRIRENPAQNQFPATLNGEPFIITWSRIPSANWLFIQHVPLKKTVP